MNNWFRQNFLTVFFGIFAFVGAIMGIVFSSFMFNLFFLRSDGIRTEGEVIDVIYSSGGGASPTVSFTTKLGESITHNNDIYTSLKVNGASPFVIVGQWHDRKTNKVYNFESDNIWYDPSAYVGPRLLRVMINPANPAQYVMDTSFLPEAGN